MEYDKAKAQADRFVELLKPACLKVEAVGSVKRHDKPEVHDIEILLIPKPGRPIPEFGKPKIYTTHLDKLISDLFYDDLLRNPFDKKNGDRYKKFAICGTDELNEFCLDIFIVTDSTWGIQNMIRTGPAWFSHRAVTNQNVLAWNRSTGEKKPGFLPNEYKYVPAKESPDKLSRIRRGSETLYLPEERDVFDLIFGSWIEPCDRMKYSKK